jgi:hypothetical protein
MGLFDGSDAAISWRLEGEGDVRFFVNGSNLFRWDEDGGEEITPENLPLLERCVADCTGSYFPAANGAWLFCCRLKKMRPRG